MVCSFGSSKMAVMARLLAGGCLSQTIAEEVGRQKLAVQCIYRELREVDEANLLDEEDMDIFGLMPMTDPLHLVCCNACKKPVKASQYAAHAEICRSLISAGETLSDTSGGIGHRRPPRKERKKLLSSSSNQATPAGKQEQSEYMNADDPAALESQLHRQPGLSSSFSINAKNVTSMMDSKGVSPESIDRSACAMPPPTKRIKLVSRRRLPLSDDRETASGLKKTTDARIASTCRDLQAQISGSDVAYDDVVVSKCPGQTFEHCPMRNGIPVPLATKIYHSQRNNLLRSVVANMYHVASAKGLCNGMVSPEVSPEGIMELRAAFQRASADEQADGLLNKTEPSASKPDQILAERSEGCLKRSGGFLPTANLSNQFPVDNILKPQTAPVGLLRNKYRPHSFAGNSGKSLGTMQQSEGSVPVL